MARTRKERLVCAFFDQYIGKAWPRHHFSSQHSQMQAVLECSPIECASSNVKALPCRRSEVGLAGFIL